MTQHTVFVCVLCRPSKLDQSSTELSAGQFLFDRLSEGFKASDECSAIHLQPVRCMGACSRSCVVAFAAPHKLTFVLSELSPTQSVPELLQFSRQYMTCAEGKVPYKERPDVVKKGIHAVLPPLPIAP